MGVLGVPRKVSEVMVGMGLPERARPERVAQACTERVAEATERPRSINENKIIEMIDDRTMMAEMLEIFLPIWRKIKDIRDLDSQLEAVAQLAPFAYARSILKGNVSEARAAADRVLDRVQGKPIERQMQVSLSMTDGEVDNEFRRISNKLGKEEIIKIITGEGAAVGVDEDRPVRSESGSKAVSGIKGKG